MTTLTYDPTEADSPEFNEEELDSLKVGEELASEQERLLAGKYTDAEELEQAYIELQRKLGDPANREAPAQDDDAEQVEEEDAEVDDFLEQLWKEANAEEYSEETLAKLEQLSSTDLAQMFLDYRASIEDGGTDEPTMSTEDIEALKDVAGGDEGYDNMIGWAQSNLTQQEIELYDSVMDSGNAAAAFFAIQALQYRYNESVGYDGNLVSGRAAPASVDAFRSQAEVVRAMSDPRYDSDAAYRQDVYDKLERSGDLQF